MKNVFTVLLLLLIFSLLGAEENPAGNSRELSLQISSLPELKLTFTQRFLFPFLQGESPVTADNNITLALSAEISPVSLNGLAEAVWTPAAFFQFFAGGRIGSGWNLSLFGSNIYGIGLNRPDAAGRAEHSGSAFDGLLWKAQTGGALQFDLAAVVPGRWNHVIARTYHEINYRGYTAAAGGESWYYENDSGENVNGFNYYGNLLIGWRPPVFLDTIALLAEADLYLYDTPGRAVWGDNRIRWTFSGLLNFTITQRLGAALIVQCVTSRNYREADWKNRYYRTRTLDTSNPLHLEFYRAAVALTYRF